MGRGLNVKFVLRTRPRSWVLAVVDVACGFGEDWSCLHTLASCPVPSPPLAIHDAHVPLICHVFKGMFAPLSRELPHIFWGECCFSRTSLPYWQKIIIIIRHVSFFTLPVLFLLIFLTAPRQESPPKSSWTGDSLVFVYTYDFYGFNLIEAFCFYSDLVLQASRRPSLVLY